MSQQTKNLKEIISWLKEQDDYDGHTTKRTKKYIQINTSSGEGGLSSRIRILKNGLIQWWTSDYDESSVSKVSPMTITEWRHTFT